MKSKKLIKLTKKLLHKLEKKERKSKDKYWSFDVKNRDDNKCVICNSDKFLHTHHIIPREVKAFRWDIDNGICICVKHHKYSYEISSHKNSFIFILWLQKNRKEQLDRLLLNYNEMIKIKKA